MNNPAALPAISSDLIEQIAMAMPSLPSALRYYDDFHDSYRSIRELDTNDDWQVVDDGVQNVIAFSKFPEKYRPILKHSLIQLFAQRDTSTVIVHFGQLLSATSIFGFELIGCLITLNPPSLRQVWTTTVVPNCTRPMASALRAILHTFCQLSIGGWTKELSPYISSLTSPASDIYKTVRSGDCFVPMDQQSKVIEYFDDLAAWITAKPSEPKTETLRVATALLFIYQHAFRPGQVARIKQMDVRVFDTGAVHYRAPLTKQKDLQKRRMVNRRVKREWGVIVIECLRRCPLPRAASVPKDTFIGLTPYDVARVTQELMEEITGGDWSATDLRHSAAQRLADAGVAHALLTEFLGHASTKTASVYFDSSPAQAQRINQALGLSPIYSAIADVAKTKTIDKSALLRLPSDQQIGAVPHGIPIAGIGACMSGQSVCAKNPVLSCYTCRKFMPVNDIARHQEVTEGLRPVVLAFAHLSRDNTESPAFVQLRRTLDGAERVIADIAAEKEVTHD
ncbi:hypothetical protein [Dongia sp.]|jgi:hypothetical protein|uniref:hypothetical protein n=1 Tax=Dongia sp. TaxID=1977262 RepID=UPI0035B1ED38